MSARPAAAAAAQAVVAEPPQPLVDYNDDPANDAACDEDFDVNFDPEYADHVVWTEEGAEAWWAMMMEQERLRRLESKPQPAAPPHAPATTTGWFSFIKPWSSHWSERAFENRRRDKATKRLAKEREDRAIQEYVGVVRGVEQEVGRQKQLRNQSFVNLEKRVDMWGRVSYTEPYKPLSLYYY